MLTLEFNLPAVALVVGGLSMYNSLWWRWWIAAAHTMSIIKSEHNTWLYPSFSETSCTAHRVGENLEIGGGNTTEKVEKDRGKIFESHPGIEPTYWEDFRLKVSPGE